MAWRARVAAAKKFLSLQANGYDCLGLVRNRKTGELWVHSSEGYWAEYKVRQRIVWLAEEQYACIGREDTCGRLGRSVGRSVNQLVNQFVRSSPVRKSVSTVFIEASLNTKIILLRKFVLRIHNRSEWDSRQFRRKRSSHGAALADK